MIKTGTVIQDSITKVELGENNEINERIIKAKKKDILDEEELQYDVQDGKLGK